MGRQLLYFGIFFLIFLLSSTTYAIEPNGDKTILHEIKMGLLAHDVDGLWSGSKREKGEDLNIEAVFSSFANLLGGDLHPVIGASINSRGYTSKIYFDGIWRFHPTDYLYGSVGIGITIHDGEKHLVEKDKKALGSQVLFHIPIEIGYNFYSQFTVSAYFDHMSSADITDENEGLDTLGIRLGYSF